MRLRPRQPPQGFQNRPPQPGKAPRCPTCDQAIDTHRRRKIVQERLQGLHEYLEQEIAEAKGNAPGYKEARSGLILPSHYKEPR